MTAPTLAVYLAHDDATFVDVTNYVARDGLSFWRGKSSVLSEWEPGGGTVTFLNRDRAVDPMNDSATYQPRPGDGIKVLLNGSVQIWGQLDRMKGGYKAAGTKPDSRQTWTFSDSLALLAPQTIVTTTTVPELTNTRISNILLFYADFQRSYSLDTGIKYVSGATDGSDINGANALSALQDVVRVEGGASALFSRKSDGRLRFLKNDARPASLVAMRGDGVGAVRIHDFDFDYTNDEWANRATLTPANYSYATASGTSLSTSPATPYTVSFVIVGGATEAGCAVVLDSDGSSAGMLGTVTAFDAATSTVTADIGSDTGSGSHTDWTVTFTPNALAQSATDAQSVARYRRTVEYKGPATLPFLGNTSALQRALLIAAGQGDPARRINSVTCELGDIRLSASDVTNMLALEVGDAISAYIDLGTGSPQALQQTRRITGIRYDARGTDSGKLKLTLGQEATLNWTAVLQQNAATVAATTNDAVYTVDSAGWVTAHLSLTSTAAGTTSGTPEIRVVPTSLPLPATSAGRSVGQFNYTDQSGNEYTGAVEWTGTYLRLTPSGAAAGGHLGQTTGSLTAFAVASTDTLDLTIRFRPA